MGPTMIDIVNQTGRMQVYRLPHQAVCVKAGVCMCKNGRHSSIHIAPYETARAVNSAVLLAPDIAKAIEKREVVVKESKIKMPVEQSMETSPGSEDGLVEPVSGKDDLKTIDPTDDESRSTNKKKKGKGKG